MSDAQQNFEQAMTDLNALVAAGPGERSPLSMSWHFLQVYSTWGLGLPADKLTLDAAIKKTPEADESFSELLLQGNKKIKAACRDFQTNIFPEMIGIASGLKNYSDLSAEDRANMFGTIKMMATTKPDAAFKLLKVMQKNVDENLEKVEAVEKQLGGFGAAIEDARGDLVQARTNLEADDDLSEAAITELMGDENQEGSLAYIQKQLQDNQEEYEHAVKVAATTPTYAWITFPIPIGPVAAVVVASVYGSKAVSLSDAIEEFQAKFEAANAKLKMALASQATVRSGEQQIAYSIAMIDRAKGHVTTVKNSWGNLREALDGLEGYIEATTATGELEANASFLLDMMAEQWAIIYPILTDLTAAPYINVKSDGEDMETLAKDVKSAQAAA